MGSEMGSEMGSIMVIKDHRQKDMPGAGIPDDISGTRAGIFHLLRTQAAAARSPQDRRGQSERRGADNTPPLPALPPLQLTAAQRLRTWQDLLTVDCFVFSQPDQSRPR